MKKIKRIGDNGGNVVFVYESDLDKLEQQRDEVTQIIEDFLLAKYQGMFDISCEADSMADLNDVSGRVNKIITQMRSWMCRQRGQTWEEIKADKHEW